MMDLVVAIDGDEVMLEYDMRWRSTRVSAIPELIEDGVTGFLVKDSAEAVAAVGHLHEIDRRSCRHRVESSFSIETMVRGYEAVYAKIFNPLA